MKLTIYVLRDDRLIAVPSDTTSDAEVREILHSIQEWGIGKRNFLFTLPNAEIIDMRPPAPQPVNVYHVTWHNGQTRIYDIFHANTDEELASKLAEKLAPNYTLIDVARVVK